MNNQLTLRRLIAAAFLLLRAKPYPIFAWLLTPQTTGICSTSRSGMFVSTAVSRTAIARGRYRLSYFCQSYRGRETAFNLSHSSGSLWNQPLPLRRTQLLSISAKTLTSRSSFAAMEETFSTTSNNACRHVEKRDEPAAAEGQLDIEKSNEVLLDTYQKVYLAVGSNLGDRFDNIVSSLAMLEQTHSQKQPTQVIRVVKTSFLYETQPMYLTDQPSFLNGAVEIATLLPPHGLLQRLKMVERHMGREKGIPFGPRPIDLDIVLYGVNDTCGKGYEGTTSINGGGWIVSSDDLIVPHPRMTEREFVLLPLSDLDRSVVHPILNRTVSDLVNSLLKKQDSDLRKDGPESPQHHATSAVRVLPLPRGRTIHLNETIIMGILNVTPDSFSDGGNYLGSAALATKQALQMVEDGAGIIDVGGESTRPGATEVDVQEELDRTIPVITSIRKASDTPISIDTRRALVAKAAIDAGADIVNDVSGGTFDPDMLRTVAELKVPIILMHMQGTPQTMQKKTNYDDVVSDVAASLLKRSAAAEHAGISRWMQVLDPGIGFAKDLNGNLSLLKHCSGKMRELVNNFPILLGPSRKGFIGKITGETRPEERDFGTVAACIVGSISDCSQKLVNDGIILRVHNVRGMKQAAMIMDAITRAK